MYDIFDTCGVDEISEETIAKIKSLIKRAESLGVKDTVLLGKI